MGTRVEFLTESGYSQGRTTGIQTGRDPFNPERRKIPRGHPRHGSGRMSP